MHETTIDCPASTSHHPHLETLLPFFCELLSRAFLNTILDFLTLRLVMRFLSALGFDGAASTSMAKSLLVLVRVSLPWHGSLVSSASGSSLPASSFSIASFRAVMFCVSNPDLCG